MEKRLFQRLGPNDCPSCGKPGLVLVEYEKAISELDKTGTAIETFVDGYDVKLMCPHCGAKFYDVDKKGTSYYIKSVSPKVKPIMKDYNPFQIQ